jgi:hypothetical protein
MIEDFSILVSHLKTHYMKKLIFILIGALLVGSTSVTAQQRGDIVSYELVREWNNAQAVEETFKLVEGYTTALGNDPETQEGVRNFLRSYIKRNLEARSLKFYKLIYHTIDFNDQPAIASGLVIIPQRPVSTCKYGMAVYNHGTLFAKDEVPSMYFDNRKYREGELFFSVIMAAMEHFTLVPDYYGMGYGTGLHHHNMDKTNSNSVIDMMRAGRKLAAALNMELTQRVVITGYSEGGSVTMATAKRIREERLQNEFPQVFIGPASGAYDMGGEAYNFIVGNPFYPTRSYILYQAASCQDMYKELYDPADPSGIDFYLRPPYNDLYRANLPTQTGNVGWVPLPWTLMFNDGVIDLVNNDPTHPLRTCLERNNTYNWQNQFETFIYYCNTDEQVPPSGAVKAYTVQQSYIPAIRFWERFRLRITENSFNGAIPDHGTCALPSMLFFMEEMRARKRNICRPNRISEDGLAIDQEGAPHYFNFPAMYKDAPIEVKAINGQSFTFLPNQQQEYNIFNLEPGIYIYRAQVAGGRTDWDYFIKAPLQFVNTEDYNPVQTDEKGKTFVDISLLEETVRRLEIYDAQGNRVKVVPNRENAIDKIQVSGRFNAGDHIIMVVTDDNAYPLKWQVKHGTISNSSDRFLAFTDNGEAQVRALTEEGIQVIELFDVKGRQLIRRVENNLSQTQINLSVYPAGMYLLLVNGSESFKLAK